MQVGERSHLKKEMIAGNLDTSFLKLIALVCMLIDHIGAAILPNVLELRVIGRVAFPLYAWCLVVGSVKTCSPLKYGLRLLMMALLSQPLYMMALNHTWSDLNILFTLLISLIAIQGIRAKWMGSEFWVPALCYLALGFLKVDYGWKGVTFILLLYLSRENRSGLFATFLAFALFWGASSSTVRNLFGFTIPFEKLPGLGVVLSSFFRLQGMIWLALPLILFHTQIPFRLPKWIGYGLYPLHLILLIVLRLMSGSTFAMLVRGF